MIFFLAFLVVDGVLSQKKDQPEGSLLLGQGRESAFGTIAKLLQSMVSQLLTLKD